MKNTGIRVTLRGPVRIARSGLTGSRVCFVFGFQLDVLLGDFRRLPIPRFDVACE